MWLGPNSDLYHGAPIARSSQLNIILHNGLHASKKEALECFNHAVEFSKKYPCRIVVLCPEKANGDEGHLKGKLFSKCFIGDDIRKECCCEALILGYSADDAAFLKDQVSLWIENDLPSYYFVNQISPKAIERYYLSLAELCCKVIYDSKVEQEGFNDISWPNPQGKSDLALMRLFPVRQSLAQFLSGYKESTIIDGLEQVIIEYTINCFAEGQQLLQWFEKCFKKCAEQAHKKFEIEFVFAESLDTKKILKSKWQYKSNNSFEWYYDCESGISEIKANFNNEKISYPLLLRQINPAEALAAAIFY